MNSHSEPFILELPNVWHLASDVKAELADVEGHVPTCLALINALHPTAAVCGTPTTVAGALIRKLEHNTPSNKSPFFSNRLIAFFIVNCDGCNPFFTSFHSNGVDTVAPGLGRIL